ncbi:hypothetical protein ZWY2020_003192 [Hordeum vulgare]|nr:hypothetical protein ZWY2020_003192 [Hordeum vulgare]
MDVHGHGIPATVASTNYMGMNALHDAGGYGKLPVYQYLVKEARKQESLCLVKFKQQERRSIEGFCVAIAKKTAKTLELNMGGKWSRLWGCEQSMLSLFETMKWHEIRLATQRRREHSNTYES